METVHIHMLVERNKKQMAQKRGVCPKCGNQNITYIQQPTKTKILAPSMITYSIDCMDCSFSGYEVYRVSFGYQTDREGNVVHSDAEPDKVVYPINRCKRCSEDRLDICHCSEARKSADMMEELNEVLRRG